MSAPKPGPSGEIRPKAGAAGGPPGPALPHHSAHGYPSPSHRPSTRNTVAQNRTCKFPRIRLGKHRPAHTEVNRGDRPGRHQRWTRTRSVSPVAGSRRTTMWVLPPCSRSGSKTALQAAKAGASRTAPDRSARPTRLPQWVHRHLQAIRSPACSRRARSRGAGPLCTTGTTSLGSCVDGPAGAR